MIIPEHNSILEKIGEFILSSRLNDDWNKAVLKIALIGKSVEFNLTFIEENTETNSKLQGAFLCSLEVAKLHELTKAHPHFRVWNRANYSIQSSGIFNIEYIWDEDLQDEFDKANSYNE